MINSSKVSTVFKNVFSFTIEGKAQFIVHSQILTKAMIVVKYSECLNSVYNTLRAYLSGFFQIFKSFLKSGSDILRTTPPRTVETAPFLWFDLSVLISFSFHFDKVFT